MAINRGILQALGAAGLFGASVPFAKALLGELPPVLLAGLLYLGAGAGLALWLGVYRLRHPHLRREAPLTRKDLPWLAAAVLTGGVLAPVLLLLGLAAVPAASASLLLNLEGVFTVLLAWLLFGEQLGRRIVAGMAVIVFGGVLLAWPGPEAWTAAAALGPVAIAAACFAWGLDNNLTRHIARADPVQIAAIKGLVAGGVNLLLAIAIGASVPGWPVAATAAAVGAAGFGLSLVLFILALRHVGAARTSAYFGLAPFFGALLSLAWLGEAVGIGFWAAGAFMALGVWLHLTETHAHLHSHEGLAHTHLHMHDSHHRHEHDFDWDGREPHTHFHDHGGLVHAHPHYPDLHHRHAHSDKRQKLVQAVTAIVGMRTKK